MEHVLGAQRLWRHFPSPFRSPISPVTCGQILGPWLRRGNRLKSSPWVPGRWQSLQSHPRCLVHRQGSVTAALCPLGQASFLKEDRTPLINLLRGVQKAISTEDGLPLPLPRGLLSPGSTSARNPTSVWGARTPLNLIPRDKSA